MIHGVHHLGLAGTDLAGAARFHGGLIGARPDAAALLAGLNLRLELHAASGSLVAPGSPALNRPGIRHYCVQNFAFERLAAAVTGGGGTLIAEPVDLGTGNAYAYARDPEGNIIEIEGLPYAPAEQANWVGHIALVTHDIAATAAFYSAVLGTAAAGPRRVGPSAAIDWMGGLPGAVLLGAWLPAGPIALELWQFEQPAFAGSAVRAHFAEPGFSHIAFACDDPLQERLRLIALGAKAADPALAAQPTPGAEAACFVSGPDGVLIELVRMADPALALAGLADRDVVSRIERR